MRLVLTAFLLAAAPCAQAQGPTPGAELPEPPAPQPSSYVRAAPLGLALELALGTSVWAQVQVSTEGPAGDVTKLVREGFYKLEVIELVLMSAKSRQPLKVLAEKRRKGARLADIATGLRIDYDELYEEALAVEEVCDREYLPRLYRRKNRKRYIE
jgi:hypothetical protein